MLHNVFGVAVVLGENQCLGHFGAAGENFGEEPFLEGADDGADLVRRHHVLVQLPGGIVEVLVKLLPADFARLAVALIHPKPGDDGRAIFADHGADAINVEAHVDPIGHGLLVVVLRNQILVEEAQGLQGRRGGEADEERIKIFQHLPPEVVDRAVALIHHNEIEKLNGDGGIITDRHRLLNQRTPGCPGAFLRSPGPIPPRPSAWKRAAEWW